jgi:ferritin-like metal-binding protein YciE
MPVWIFFRGRIFDLTLALKQNPNQMTPKTQSRRPSSRKKTPPKSYKENLEDIFADLLKDIYWAEKYLAKALPKLAKASYNTELQEAFDNHAEETNHQVTRVEKCFDILEMKPVAKRCEAMEGLGKEATSAIADYDKGHARDAALIAAAQKVEHYEISAYGTLRTMANLLGKSQCAELLEETKDEEAQADVKLTEVADKINQLAAEAEIEAEEVA